MEILLSFCCVGGGVGRGCVKRRHLQWRIVHEEGKCTRRKKMKGTNLFHISPHPFFHAAPEHNRLINAPFPNYEDNRGAMSSFTAMNVHSVRRNPAHFPLSRVPNLGSTTKFLLSFPLPSHTVFRPGLKCGNSTRATNMVVKSVQGRDCCCLCSC